VNPLRRFLKRYRGHLLHLYAEEYVGWLLRGLPGPEGMVLRGLFYRLLFKRTASLPLIYAGVYLTHTYGLEVGRHFSVNSGSLLDARGGIRVGNWVMVGPQVAIVSSEHDYMQTERPMASLDHQMRPVVIEDDVWIGAHAFIRGGIKIGQGAVIAAGAMVVADVAPWDIVGGVPAKVIGHRRPGRSADMPEQLTTLSAS
jgi:acetyltransferase-like isoleucine patch superfamily enzyme